MKSLHQALQSILSQPTTADLVALQGALLARGGRDQAVDRALEVAGRFHTYLCELQSKISARDYSELASRLDIGAVGAVAVENVVAGEGEKLWQRLLLGGLGESMMVAASRQYIKAWEVEAGLIHTCAAWYLTDALWRASCDMQPSLPPGERWQAIQALVAPAYNQDVPSPDKAVLLVHVFQMLLLTYVARLLPAAEGRADE